MDLTEQDREVLLAALFELQLTHSTFVDDPHAGRIPRRHSRSVAKLGGERGTALFGACRDEWAEGGSPAPEYADETDER